MRFIIGSCEQPPASGDRGENQQLLHKFSNTSIRPTNITKPPLDHLALPLNYLSLPSPTCEKMPNLTSVHPLLVLNREDLLHQHLPCTHHHHPVRLQAGRLQVTLRTCNDAVSASCSGEWAASKQMSRCTQGALASCSDATAPSSPL